MVLLLVVAAALGAVRGTIRKLEHGAACPARRCGLRRASGFRSDQGPSPSSPWRDDGASRAG